MASDWVEFPFAKRAPCGFTLVELLLALATMGLILGAAYTSLFSGLDSFRRSAYESEVYTVLHRSLDRVFADLACSFNASEGTRFVLEDESIDHDVYGSIPTDVLRFQAHLMKVKWDNTPQSDLTEIEYYIDMDDETPPRWLVRRTESPADQDPVSGGEVHLVGPAVIGMDVQLHNGSKWVSTWDSRTDLPVAVKVELVMEPANHPDGGNRLERFSSIFWIPTSGDTGTVASSESASNEAEGGEE
jgi:prepilin-type N-terminal cleavage/methylation domain-containing protein